MAQDIREMFSRETAQKHEKLARGHQKRFEAKLDKAYPEQKRSGSGFFFLKIAAILIVAFGVGLYFLQSRDVFTESPAVVDSPVEEQEIQENERSGSEAQFQLSEVSPEFKKIEDYYLASLNVELAKIDVNDDNRALINSFMDQLEDLDEEYKILNTEINENGLNEQSIEAMIANLQLRLELLYKLKNKLNEINQSKNEQYENHQA